MDLWHPREGYRRPDCSGISGAVVNSRTIGEETSETPTLNVIEASTVTDDVLAPRTAAIIFNLMIGLRGGLRRKEPLAGTERVGRHGSRGVQAERIGSDG